MLKTVKKPLVLPLDYRSRADLPAFTLPDVLPTDSAALTALLIASVDAKIAADEHITHAEKYIALAEAAFETRTAIAAKEFETRLRELYEQIILMRRRMFGASSESAGQLHLFDEAEVLAATSTEAQDVAPLPAGQSSKARAR